MSSSPPILLLSYEPSSQQAIQQLQHQFQTRQSLVIQRQQMSGSTASTTDSLETRELPKIVRNVSQPADKAKKKKKLKKQPQQPQQQHKSLSDSESRKHFQPPTIEWRNPNQIDYSDPNRQQRRGADPDGINAPLLHRRIDAALQRMDRLGSPKKIKKEISDLREEFTRLEARIHDYQEMKDSLTYQQSVVSSINARLSKMETEMKRLTKEAAELSHLIRSPGALEEEQLRVTREKITKKRQQHGATANAAHSNALPNAAASYKLQ